jgi:hypothetical protein
MVTGQVLVDIIGMAGHSWDFPLKLHPQYFSAVYKPPHSSSAEELAGGPRN